MNILKIFIYILGVVFISGVFLWKHNKVSETTILLVRHGQTDWNMEQRVQGHSDIPLNETGVLQAKTTAAFLVEHHRDISAIYSSDLKRASATAEETAKLLSLKVQQREKLREINTGEAEGMKISEKVKKYKDAWKKIKENFPNQRDAWKQTAIAGEESIDALYRRIEAELIFLGSKHRGKKIAVFSHGKAIRAFIAHITDKNIDDIELSNAQIIEIKLIQNGDGLSFKLAN